MSSTSIFRVFIMNLRTYELDRALIIKTYFAVLICFLQSFLYLGHLNISSYRNLVYIDAALQL